MDISKEIFTERERERERERDRETGLFLNKKAN